MFGINIITLALIVVLIKKTKVVMNIKQSEYRQKHFEGRYFTKKVVGIRTRYRTFILFQDYNSI